MEIKSDMSGNATDILLNFNQKISPSKIPLILDDPLHLIIKHSFIEKKTLNRQHKNIAQQSNTNQ